MILGKKYAKYFLGLPGGGWKKGKKLISLAFFGPLLMAAFSWWRLLPATTVVDVVEVSFWQSVPSSSAPFWGRFYEAGSAVTYGKTCCDQIYI
jgi:hypothetical protein